MKWIPFGVLVLVLLGHFFYTTRSPVVSTQDGEWATYQFDRPAETRLARYLAPGEHWLGLSYALAGSFATLCFCRILMMRREALATSAGGITLSGILWAAACFLTGCCGSPMLPIYLGLFGPKFIGVTKPLTFGVTLLSIVVGYAWMTKRTPQAIADNVNAHLHENVGTDPGEV